MRKNAFIFAILYAIAAIADLYFVYNQQESFRFFSKPLLLPLLMTYYLSSVGMGSKFAKLMAAALLFSWLGDVLLLWDSLFIPGLLAFLIAHIFYIIYFVKIEPSKKGLIRSQPLFGTPVLVFWGLFLAFLFPYLEKLRIPVFVYATVICTMLLCSINLSGKLKRPVFLLFLNGALQFVLSDSLLAINKFVFPFWFLPLCVMLTYCSAQYLLVRGSIRQVRY
jgi:uncharacterized membrane protein YhhN